MSNNKSNIVKCKFSNHKNSALNKRKKRARFLAIIGTLLMISGLISSIICYL